MLVSVLVIVRKSVFEDRILTAREMDCTFRTLVTVPKVGQLHAELKPCALLKSSCQAQVLKYNHPSSVLLSVSSVNLQIQLHIIADTIIL